MYHLEMRQFPKRVHRFNLTGQEIGAIVLPWVQERIVELGEQKWSPHQAELTILEGPEIPIDGVSLGRGWRVAEHEGQDVTERILAEAREAVAAAAQASPPGAPQGSAPAPAQGAVEAPAGAAGLPDDPLALGVELASLLGSEPGRLLAAWREVATRAPTLAPSESLALAERELAAPGP